eukprot:TRINITY_DN2082_c0_g1_i1.p1 TRINITY_DN2082_c0_g1~~TRINITY_DN2082_c0_g1_i1.p1  ORF type:complete len:1002 (-),score=157.94 TRINITY_DN2082_c0_g1_i1:188-3193(-)
MAGPPNGGPEPTDFRRLLRSLDAEYVKQRQHLEAALKENDKLKAQLRSLKGASLPVRSNDDLDDRLDLSGGAPRDDSRFSSPRGPRDERGLHVTPQDSELLPLQPKGFLACCKGVQDWQRPYDPDDVHRSGSKAALGNIATAIMKPAGDSNVIEVYLDEDRSVALQAEDAPYMLNGTDTPYALNGAGAVHRIQVPSQSEQSPRNSDKERAVAFGEHVSTIAQTPSDMARDPPALIINDDNESVVAPVRDANLEKARVALNEENLKALVAKYPNTLLAQATQDMTHIAQLMTQESTVVLERVLHSPAAKKILASLSVADLRAVSRMCLQSWSGFAQSRKAIPEKWPFWQDRPDTRMWHSKLHVDSESLLKVEATTGEAMKKTPHPSCIDRLVLRPNSVSRLSWDGCSALMVGYDLITIPLMTFEIDNLQLVKVMDYATSTFWLLDIPCTFLTGFTTESRVEMRPGRIATQYLKSWFAVDFTIVVIDWFFLLLSTTGFIGTQEGGPLGFFRVFKTTRALRILRALRLIRFIRLNRVLHHAYSIINNEYIRLMCNVILSFALIMGANHYLACLWYFIGISFSDSPNWIENGDWAPQGHKDTTQLYRYVTSLHWSLTQFTPAGMEVRPYNVQERIYSICVLFLAMLTFSSFLGTITATMTQMRQLHNASTKQQHALRAYFKERSVSADLAQSIWKFLRENHFNHKTKSSVKADIPLLKLLPPNLNCRLHEELYRPYITRCPFFLHYMAIDPESLRDICDTCVSEHCYVTGDQVFGEGHLAEQMVFISSGVLQYEHPDKTQRCALLTGQYVTEAALWMQWVHCARCYAGTSSDCIVLSVQMFHKAVKMHLGSFSFCKTYCEKFVQMVRESEDWQTDIWSNKYALRAIIEESVFDVMECPEVFMGFGSMASASPYARTSSQLRAPTQDQPLWRRCLGLSLTSSRPMSDQRPSRTRSPTGSRSVSYMSHHETIEDLGSIVQNRSSAAGSSASAVQSSTSAGSADTLPQ